MLKDAVNRGEKRRAAGLLADIGEPAMESLLALLKDEDAIVRAYSAGALGSMKSERVVPPLIALLNDGDSYVRRTAAESLGRTGSSQAIQPLVEALEDQTRDMANAAVRALEQIKHPDVIPLLIKALHNPTWNATDAAAQALGEMGAPEAIGPLVQCFEEMPNCPYHLVGRALWKLNSERAVDAWIAGLEKGAWWYPRAACATELGNNKLEKGLQPLQDALKDESPEVRRAAVLALMEFRSEKTIEAPGSIEGQGLGGADVRAKSAEENRRKNEAMMNMKFRNHGLRLAVLCCLLWAFVFPVWSSANAPPKWEVRSSVVVEAICFVNALVGDPYYLDYFQEDYDYFQARFRPGVQEALSRIRKWRDREQCILSSRLLTIIPDLTAKTLDDLLLAIDQPGDRYNLTEEEYARIAPDLRTVFAFLRDEGFAQYWQAHRLPEVEAKIAEFAPMFSIVNLIPAIENILGHPLEAQKNGMTLLVVSFTRPNSIALNRYTIIPPDISAKTLVRTSIHELLHAFEAPPGSELEHALQSLSQDDFVMARFRKRNPAYGYNTFDGYLEENAVRALDQCLAERFGIAKNARWRWLTTGGGMHVFAAALDYLIKREGFPREGESFGGFYLRMVNEGKIGPGKIEGLYKRYYPWRSWRAWALAGEVLLRGAVAFFVIRFTRRKTRVGATR